MISKIALTVVFLVLGMLAAHHYSTGDQPMLAGDVVVALMCYLVFWQPGR